MYYVVGLRANARFAERVVLSTHPRKTLAERVAASFRAHLEDYQSIEVERAGGLSTYDAAREGGRLSFCSGCQRGTTRLYTCRHCRTHQCSRCNFEKKCCGKISPRTEEPQ